MKNFLQMKYEQFLMRCFDLIYKLLSKTRIDWYPRYILEEINEDIHNLERRNDLLEYYLLRSEERVRGLEEKLYFYEPWEDEDEP